MLFDYQDVNIYLTLQRPNMTSSLTFSLFHCELHGESLESKNTKQLNIVKTDIASTF